MTEPTIRPLPEYEPAADGAAPAQPPLAEAGAMYAAGSPMSMADEFLSRARTARDQHGGQPPEAWSTGEQSAVALLLGSTDTLQRLDMTPEQACIRLADDLGISPHEARTWVDHHRQTLKNE